MHRDPMSFQKFKWFQQEKKWTIILSTILKFLRHRTNLFNGLLFRPLLRGGGGGGGTIYSNGCFFVQIFADRYIYRRELRMVSLESSSSVEFGIKKIFIIFVFYRELSRFKLLRKVEWIHVVLFTFSKIFD